LKHLSLEYAVELSRLLQHKMEEGIYSHVQDDRPKKWIWDKLWIVKYITQSGGTGYNNK